MKIRYERPVTKNHVMELYDKPSPPGGAKFALLDHKAAAALCPLLDGSNVNKMRLKVFIEPNAKYSGEFPGQMVSRTLNLSIMLYAPRKFVDGIGRQLSQKGHFLSAPLNPGRNVEYYNPHEPKDFSSIRGPVRKPQSSQATYGVARTQEDILRRCHKYVRLFGKEVRKHPRNGGRSRSHSYTSDVTSKASTSFLNGT